MKFIIYCRKSTDSEDRQVLSIESQENELLELVKRDNLEVVKIYKESKSAKSPGRPIFNEMLKFVSTGKAEGILCWKIDRLTRNPIDGGQIQWLSQQNKIKIIRTFEREYLPNDNALIMSIEAAMANQYIRELSANVKRGNRAKLKKGEWPGPAPIGYINNRVDKTIGVDKTRAAFIAKAYELYSTGGYSLKDLSNLLYKQGFRTRPGKKVFRSELQRIFRNPFYCGIMRREEKYYQGNHQPIISQTLFNQVNDLLDGKHHSKKQKHLFPLRGFMRCEVCGCALTATKKKEHLYYYCTNGKGQCEEHKKYLRAEDINKEVAEIFSQIKIDEELIELAYRAAQEEKQNDLSYAELSAEAITKQQGLLKERQRRLLDNYLAGHTPEEAYNEKMAEFNLEEATIKNQLKQIEQKRQGGISTLEQIKSVFLLANKAKNEYVNADDEKMRELAKTLLWNILIKGQKMASYQLKMPYQLLVGGPKITSFSDMRAVGDSNP